MLCAEKDVVVKFTDTKIIDVRLLRAGDELEDRSWVPASTDDVDAEIAYHECVLEDCIASIKYLTGIRRYAKGGDSYVPPNVTEEIQSDDH